MEKIAKESTIWFKTIVKDICKAFDVTPEELAKK